MDDVEHNVRENSESDRSANRRAATGTGERDGKPGQDQASADRMRVRDEIEVHGVGRNLCVLDPEISEQDPEQLYELN
jgi:hypothetical protein